MLNEWVANVRSSEGSWAKLSIHLGIHIFWLIACWLKIVKLAICRSQFIQYIVSPLRYAYCCVPHTQAFSWYICVAEDGDDITRQQVSSVSDSRAGSIEGLTNYLSLTPQKIQNLPVYCSHSEAFSFLANTSFFVHISSIPVASEVKAI